MICHLAGTWGVYPASPWPWTPSSSYPWSSGKIMWSRFWTLLGPSGRTPEAPCGVHFKALNRSIAWGRICDSQFCLAFILFTHKIWKPIPNMQNTCDFVCPHAMLRWAHAPPRPGDALGTLPGHSRGALGRPGNAPEHHFGPQKRPQSEHEKRHFFRDVCL